VTAGGIPRIERSVRIECECRLWANGCEATSGPLRKLTSAIADTAITVINAAVASGVATAITAILITITGAVTRAIATTVAITVTVATAIDTARRRRRRSIDLAARRRRRRSIDYLAARRRRRRSIGYLAARRRRRRSIDYLAARPRRRRRRWSIDLAAAAPVGDGSTVDDWSTGNRQVGCFGLGGNGGGSQREDCRGHDGYPA
jgi:hypothetical protein